MISGFSETDQVRDTQKLGAGRFIRKPFSCEELAGAIRAELDKKTPASESSISRNLLKYSLQLYNRPANFAFGEVCAIQELHAASEFVGHTLSHRQNGLFLSVKNQHWKSILY